MFAARRAARANADAKNWRWERAGALRCCAAAEMEYELEG